MTTRNRTREILDIKQRDARWNRFGAHGLELLRRQWEQTGDGPASTPDFYVIRSVTLLEVFTRGNIADLVDHDRQFTDRAIELSKHFKLDFNLLRDIQGRIITLGDIVAHSVPVNSLGQIVGYFETLLGKPLRPLLETAVDRWGTEIMGKPSRPVIDDFDAVAQRLTRLFEVRHILCHEAPEKPVYTRTEISGFLDRAIQFTTALYEVLSFEKYGLVPLTQTEMNIAAGRDLKDTEEQLAHLLSEIESKVRFLDVKGQRPDPSPADGGWLHSLNDAQERWRSYRDAQCEFQTYPNRGGTVRPLLWASEAIRLTRLRTAELQSWLEEASERYYFGDKAD